MPSTITYPTLLAYKDFLSATHPELLNSYSLLVDAIFTLHAEPLVISLDDLDNKETFGTLTYSVEGEVFHIAFRPYSAFILKAPSWLSKEECLFITVQKTVEDAVWFIQKPYSSNKPII